MAYPSLRLARWQVGTSFYSSRFLRCYIICEGIASAELVFKGLRTRVYLAITFCYCVWSMQGTCYGRDNFSGMDNLHHRVLNTPWIESSCHKFDLRSEVFVSIGGGNVFVWDILSPARIRSFDIKIRLPNWHNVSIFHSSLHFWLVMLFGIDEVKRVVADNPRRRGGRRRRGSLNSSEQRSSLLFVANSVVEPAPKPLNFFRILLGKGCRRRSTDCILKIQLRMSF